MSLITATDLAQWAAQKEARAYLPSLLRRLIHASGVPTTIDFPAGDSTDLPGWDGYLVTTNGNAWVPVGTSGWEMSCQVKVKAKADNDYKKRTDGTNKSERKKMSYIAITARRWTTKTKWKKEIQAKKEWAEVHAYDCDDIEQWLEQSPSVALNFAEYLGKIGPGVESVEKHWQTWANQSTPNISPESFFANREHTRDELVKSLMAGLETGARQLITIKADSAAEAAAFACATLITNQALSSTSLVVTAQEGWRYIEANPSLRIAVVARPDLAESPSSRPALTTILPISLGSSSNIANRVIELERPRIESFQKALTQMGLDKAEATRLAKSSGRSWSVFRRRKAHNLAISTPAWLKMAEAQALAPLCLLGSWQADNRADQSLVSRLSGRPYEELERALQHLAITDDAPILQIGSCWKAKAPLELLDLYGDRITRAELERFFELAQEVLNSNDPQLELPPEDRWAAAVRGKKRENSDAFLQSLCDSLIKLAVRGPSIPFLRRESIELRIGSLIRNLLFNAGNTRWLSLASWLPELAEAAPDNFLEAIEHSFTQPEPPVIQLIAETGGPVFAGRCWHSGLLWALEILAWDSKLLPRVALILARLAKEEIKGNWGNTPLASLVDIFRPWIPQTSAKSEERLAILDLLLDRENAIAYKILDNMVRTDHDTASPTAHPKWRGIDIGSDRGITLREDYEMRIAALDRLINNANGDPHRINLLLNKINAYANVRGNEIRKVVEKFSFLNPTDDSKEIVRDNLRNIIHRLINHNKIYGAALNQKLLWFNNIYEKLTPKDNIVKFLWLFRSGWVDLPVKVTFDGKASRDALLKQMQINALKQIFKLNGFAGLEKLALSCGKPFVIGFYIMGLGINFDEIISWLMHSVKSKIKQNALLNIFDGLFRSIHVKQLKRKVTNVINKIERYGWSNALILKFLLSLPANKTIWDIISSNYSDLDELYWKKIESYKIFYAKDEEANYAVRRFLHVNRPKSALDFLHYKYKNVKVDLLVEILELMISSNEDDCGIIKDYNIQEIFKYLESSKDIEASKLIELEFAYHNALHYHDGRPIATALYKYIMSFPNIFVDMLCLIYKPRHDDSQDKQKTQSEINIAHRAFDVLHHCHHIPGTGLDGNINESELVAFIKQARMLAEKVDRLVACDHALGGILAYAPADPDGSWPCLPIRNILDQSELGEVRAGFKIGVQNSRGPTSRSLDEGGAQERVMAEKYRAYAHLIRTSHPRVCTILEAIANSYDWQANAEDLDVEMRKEEY